MPAAGFRVHRLHCGCLRGLSMRGQPATCRCLLVETPASGLVLVDTGLGTPDMEAPQRRLGWAFTLAARPRREPAATALRQVQALGYQAADVRHIVLTHMDLDHVGGLSDFPQARVHLHAAEHRAALARQGIKGKARYLPATWAHQPRFETYAETGEPWFGFEAVRQLRGLPPELLLVPLFGHTWGHCGVAVQQAGGAANWLLHAGDAYFDPRSVHQLEPACAWNVALFEALVQTDRRLRLHNQDRLRRLIASEPGVEVVNAHDPW